MRKIFAAWIKQQGVFPLYMFIFAMVFLVFALLGGAERINPFDGKSWSDFDKATEEG